MTSALRLTYQFFKNITFIVCGTLVALTIIIYCVLSIPVFLYRWLIAKFVSPYLFCFNTRKAVNVASNTLSLDSLEQKKSPRCGIIVNLVIEGHAAYTKVYQSLEEKWIKAKDSQGKLKYPELQQYLESWMGVMFWKPDKDYQLKNHIKFLEIDKNGNDEDSERFLVNFGEDLLNRPFFPRRSPWEIYLIHNYKNSALQAEKGMNSGPLTLIIFRFHHCMVDGYAILHLLLEELAGNPLDKTLVAIPSTGQNHGTLKKLINCVTFPIRTLHELGKLITWSFKKRTMFHIPDSKKNWMQIYARAPLIPLSKIRLIKSASDVGFASVLNSACGVALGRMLEKLEGSRKAEEIPKSMLFGVVVPKPNHPKKLRIHALGVAFDIPITPYTDPIGRLKICEKRVLEVRDSPMPLISDFGLKVFSAQPAPVAKLLLTNRYLATGMTSFPGPGIQVKWNGGPTVLAMDFAAGCMVGCGGIAFMALTYDGNLQICATAETAALCRDDLNELLGYVCEEINLLHRLAVRTSNSSSQLNILID